MKEKKNRKIYIFMLAFMLVMGITFAFIMPILQDPDEQTHLNYLTKAYNIDGFYEQYLRIVTITAVVPDVIFNHEHISEEIDDVVRNTKLDKDAISVGVPGPMIIRYLPGGIGLLTGILLGLTPFGCIILARIFSLIFASLICVQALYYMPVRKEMFMATLLLPIAIQQYASINYDCIILPVIALYFAYIMHFVYTDRKFRLKNLLFSLVCLMVIAAVKVPYVFVGLLFFMIPSEKMEIKIIKWQLSDIYKGVKKYWYFVVPSVLIIVGAAVYVTRRVFLVDLVLSSLKNITYYGHLIINSFKEYFNSYSVGAVGNFGWLDAPIPYYAMMIIYVVLIILALKKDENETIDLGIKKRLIIIAYIVILGNLIFISMMRHTFKIMEINLDETTVEAAILNLYCILGVQGRYFIPFLPATGILFKPFIKLKNREWILFQGIYYAFIFVISVVTITDRYWV